MYLTAEEIRDGIASGELGIDPQPEEILFGGFTVVLRFGTSIAIADRSPNTIAIGDRFVVKPSQALLATTLEYLRLPNHLAGFLYPLVSLERGGLSLSPTIVSPGFQGKLGLVVRNVNRSRVVVYPGMRLIHLCLAHLRQPVRNFNTHPLTEESSTVEDPSDITALKARLERAAPRRSPAAASDEELLRRLSDVVSASGPERGKALERLVVDLFMTLDGLQILRCNARLLAEELDIVLKNDLTNGFWRIAGSPIIVECKNWSGKVGAREISVMVDKMRSISPDVKTGILVAMNGISGDAHRDAMLKVREARQRGQYILVLERSDIEEACSGISLAQLLERKYEALVLL